MLADYVMKSIDSLFSHKLNNNELHAISKHSKHNEPKVIFNRDTIKKSLNTVIKKGNDCSRSPNATADRQPSPISKSRLKVILEHNKGERLKSVVKKVENGMRQTSPYQKIEVDAHGMRPKEVDSDGGEVLNKENNIIKYYRQVRKSIDKANLEKSGLKDGKKSRIFGKNSILSRSISKGDFRADRF